MEELLRFELDEIAPRLPIGGYLFLGVFGISFFFFQHLVLHVLISWLYPKYAQLASREFHEYRMQVNAIIHAVFCSILSYYCTFYTCGDGKTFFNDEECRNVPRNSHLLNSTYTASYLTVETIYIIAYTGCQTTIDKQTLVHHILGVVNYFIVFWPQDFTLVVAVVQLLIEASTPFVCLRWLYFHHGLKGSSIQSLNSIILLLLFIAVRIVFHPYLVYEYMWPYAYTQWFEKEGVSLSYQLLLVELFSSATFLILLNFYWVSLMFKGLYRILKQSGDETFDGKIEKNSTSTTIQEEARGDSSIKRVEMKQMLDPEQPKSDFQ